MIGYKMTNGIQVFRDLHLRGVKSNQKSLRESLINLVPEPWSVDLKRSQEVAKSSGCNEDVILFRVKQTENHPAAGLTLWETDDGYYVPNIVPMESGKLTYTQYNKILESFASSIANKAASENGYTISMTSEYENLSDWISEDVATKLNQFSKSANKSTGAGHPSDEKRWLDFLITMHRSGKSLDASTLIRWLVEVEGWNNEIAHELGTSYENGLSLLNYYDAN